MNTAFDNFIKGPLTSLLGLVLMGAAGYGWFVDYLTDWQAGGAGIAGFALLFMRDKLPAFITQFFKALIEKFTGNKTPLILLLVVSLNVVGYVGYAQTNTNTRQIRFFPVTTASDTVPNGNNDGRMWYDFATDNIRAIVNGVVITVNGGSGGGSSTWGSITGNISNQTDLQSLLDTKQATLVSGTNIKTINSTSILGSGNISITPGGSNTQVQFNDSGAFGGDSGFTYNKTTDVLTVPQIVQITNGNTTPEILRFVNQDYQIYRSNGSTVLTHRSGGDFSFNKSTSGVESNIFYLDGTNKRARLNSASFSSGGTTFQMSGGFITSGAANVGNGQNIITSASADSDITLTGSAYNFISSYSGTGNSYTNMQGSIALADAISFSGFSSGTPSLYSLLMGNHNSGGATHHLFQFGTGLSNTYGLATWSDWTYQPKFYFGNNNVVYTSSSNKAAFVIANGFLNNGNRADPASYSSHSFTHFNNGWTQINTTNNGFLSGGTALTESDVTPKAAFEVVSTNSGVLVPRLTNTQFTNIPAGNLVDGLLLYESTNDILKLRANNTWVDLGAGGSGITGTLTSGRVPYATGTSTVADNTKFQWSNATEELFLDKINISTAGTIYGTDPSSAIFFLSSDGTSGSNNGGELRIKAGNAYTVSGNGSGGDLYIQTGSKRSAGSGTDGDIYLDPSNGHIRIPTTGATSHSMGRATLVGGTVTVTNAKVTANTNIFLTIQAPGGTVGSVYVSARSAGTSFTITSTSGTDTSTVSWLLIEPN